MSNYLEQPLNDWQHVHVYLRIDNMYILRVSSINIKVPYNKTDPYICSDIYLEPGSGIVAITVIYVVYLEYCIVIVF